MERPAAGAKTDTELMELVALGSHEAFSELVTRHTPRFYHVAYRVLFNRTDAEDIVQDAFLKLWTNPAQWDAGRGGRFTTWFYRVVTNLSIDLRRKKRPLRMTEGVEAAGGDPAAGERVEAAGDRELIKRLILSLPENQQTALNLCYYEGLSNREAAEIMEVSVKALESMLTRGKKALKERARPGSSAKEGLDGPK